MIDAQGIELIKGDRVAFTSSAVSDLLIGTITGFSVRGKEHPTDPNEEICTVVVLPGFPRESLNQTVRTYEIALIPPNTEEDLTKRDEDDRLTPESRRAYWANRCESKYSSYYCVACDQHHQKEEGL